MDTDDRICDDCFYRLGFEAHLPMPFWFRLKFRLRYYLLGYRVKPLS